MATIPTYEEKVYDKVRGWWITRVIDGLTSKEPKTIRYFFSLLIVASPFLMSLTVKHIGNNASAFFQTNTWFVWVILLVSILLYVFSALISVMIYKKSDL